MNAPIDVSGVQLHTQRLTLRPWRQSDLEDFFEYASVEGVGQMAGWLPHRDIQDSQKILDSFITKKKTFALDYQGKVIGSLGVEEYDEEQFPALLNLRCRALGFVLSKNYWGRGLMPEAVDAVLEYGFTELGLQRIWCGHYAGNWRSKRVMEKCGFRYQFSSTEFVKLVGETRQSYFYLLTKEGWRERVSGAV